MYSILVNYMYISTPFLCFLYLTGYPLENWTENEAMNTVNIMILMGHYYTLDTIPYNIMMIICNIVCAILWTLPFFYYTWSDTLLMLLITSIQQLQQQQQKIIAFSIFISLWKISCFKSIFHSLNLKQLKEIFFVWEIICWKYFHKLIFKGNPIENLISVIYQKRIITKEKYHIY